MNIYSDEQQSALKYLKNIEVNLNNVCIMTGDFNIRDNDWNLLYPHHFVHTNTLMKLLTLSILVFSLLSLKSSHSFSSLYYFYFSYF